MTDKSVRMGLSEVQGWAFRLGGSWGRLGLGGMEGTTVDVFFVLWFSPLADGG